MSFCPKLQYSGGSPHSERIHEIRDGVLTLAIDDCQRQLALFLVGSLFLSLPSVLLLLLLLGIAMLLLLVLPFLVLSVFVLLVLATFLGVHLVTVCTLVESSCKFSVLGTSIQVCLSLLLLLPRVFLGHSLEVLLKVLLDVSGLFSVDECGLLCRLFALLLELLQLLASLSLSLSSLLADLLLAVRIRVASLMLRLSTCSSSVGLSCFKSGGLLCRHVALAVGLLLWRVFVV